MIFLSIKINDVAIVIYARSQREVVKSFYFVQPLVQLGQVTQAIIIYNCSKKLPSELKSQGKIQILETKDNLTQGAALNKALPHLWAQHSLLLDPEVLSSSLDIEQILSKKLPFLSRLFINIPLSSHKASAYSSYQTFSLWGAYNLSLISFLSWGAVIFDNNFVFTLGGFDEKLSFDDLMVDLSMRAHQHQAVIIQYDMKPIDAAVTAYSQGAVQRLLSTKYFSPSAGLWNRFVKWIKDLTHTSRSNKLTAFKDLQRRSLEDKTEIYIH